MDYNNIILLARERHAELIKNTEDNARQVGNGNTVAVPNVFDRAVIALKAMFAKPANVQPTGAIGRKLVTK